MFKALVAPYTEGTRFVHALRREGGWAKVDEAWRRPPTTTEQLLHPERWAAAEEPLPVPAPSPQWVGEAFRSVDEDTLGELMLRLTAQGWLGEQAATAFGRGWGGDRFTLATDGSSWVLLGEVHYDEEPAVKGKAQRSLQSAERDFSLLRAAIRGQRGDGPLVEDSGAQPFVCRARGDLGVLAAARRQGRVRIVAGPSALGAGRAQGSCAHARRWLTAAP
jgi:hypothetical protein